ncbi:MAG: succinyl-diaminopimelate desuccinylase [Lysobacterales bacterium]
MRGPSVALTCELIRCRSVTPEDAGCQALISERLKSKGFTARQLDFADVKNLWVSHGNTGPVTAFLGHTDVVPSGPVDQWRSDPFEPTVQDGVLTGRGAADMKGAVAAMVVALEQFVESHPDHHGTVGLLVTSDEEGVAEHGIAKAAPALEEAGVHIDYCLVGEPSSIDTLGDNIRVGRRGSLNAQLSVLGVQGHAAFPHRADNAIHRATGVMKTLVDTSWDSGCDLFPATSFQISNVSGGVGATNVIPGRVDLQFNFRFGTASPATDLQQRVERILDESGVQYELAWQLSGQPFSTPEGALLEAVDQAVAQWRGSPPVHDTGGGTSDGRFIAPLGAQVVELGLKNATIHKIDECAEVADIEQLSALYLATLKVLENHHRANI